MEKGKFISFEGIDGAGKSAHIDFAQQILESAGLSVVRTREPGATILGETLRHIVLEKNAQFSPKTHALLMYAARVELTEKTILPSLKSGSWVLSDRFLDATFAYQGGGENLGLDQIAVLNTWALGDFLPDLTLLFEVDLETAQNRILQSRTKKDHFENLNTEFFNRVQNAYLKRQKEEPKRIKIINSNLDLKKVRKYVEMHILKILEETKWKLPIYIQKNGIFSFKC